MPVYRLTEALGFPSPRLAGKDGLLAVGGDLSVPRLLLAYRLGIFPWYSQGDPILWWAPDPRLVLFPAEFHLSSRLARRLRRAEFRITMDQAFGEVISQCAGVRTENGLTTWINEEMVTAYTSLHAKGFAHSVECWQGDRLVGGLYGVSLGAVFFGESMFSLVTDSSKAALAALVDFLRQNAGALIDCQVSNAHLKSLGAREIPAADFHILLERNIPMPPTMPGSWRAWTRPAEESAHARRKTCAP